MPSTPKNAAKDAAAKLKPQAASGASSPGAKAGELAPDFTLDSPDGKVSLSSLKGRYVVVYFYPRDKTPGCTREGQAFSQAAAAFKKAGAVVLGVSKDSVTSHASFKESCAITVPLLSDPDLAVHKAYGAYGEKTNYGKTTLGTLRTTVIVEPNGHVLRVFPKVKVDGHSDAVLAAIVEHGKTQSAPLSRGKGR